MAERKKIVVRRDKWARDGHWNGVPPFSGDRGTNLLRSEDGCMCIMGWVLVALGVQPEHLLNLGDPDNLPTADKEKLPSSFWATEDGETPTSWQAVNWNDTSVVSDKERETKLAGIFRPWGIDLVFEDPPSTP